LRGFTALADREDPHRVVGCLNVHLEVMGDPILERSGEILNEMRANTPSNRHPSSQFH
jgi:hypothetical protein